MFYLEISTCLEEGEGRGMQGNAGECRGMLGRIGDGVEVRTSRSG